MKGKKMSKTFSVLLGSYIAMLILGVYFYTPTIRLDFADFWFISLLPILLIGAVFVLSQSEDFIDEIKLNHPMCLGLVRVLLVSLLALVCITILTSWGLFRSSAYKNLITVQESVFSSDHTEVDPNQIRIVDQDMALRLGEKKIGEDSALGSRAQVGQFTIQTIGGKLYWVAPIVHSGFFKWWKYSSEGTPGYVKVSATDERDVSLVSGLHIRYQPESFYGQNLERHIYFNGFITRGVSDYTFEVDDAGKPYWVGTIYRKAVGFFGKDATGVVVVDAQSGEVLEYAIEKAPSWIDRIQPEEFVAQQLTDWGEFVHGWLNPSNEDRLKVTPGISLVYGGGQSYWYTGLTSYGADESTVGFVLVNTRTKESKMYKQGGATELAAMRSAEGRVQEKGYNSSFPVLYNVSGAPTYVMSLKDKGGLVKAVAFVSVEDYSLVGVGETTERALRNYHARLARTGTAKLGTAASSKSISGKLSRIGYDAQYEVYIFTIEQSHLMFFGGPDLSREFAISRPGDVVKISWVDVGKGEVDISSFDNVDVPKDIQVVTPKDSVVTVPVTVP